MEWTNKKLKSIWPQDIPFSDYKCRIIRKIIKDKYKNYAITDLVRNLIKEKFLNFKPSTQEFDCETTEYMHVPIPRIRWPIGRQPNLTHMINGGYRNIRKELLDEYD